MKKLRQMTDSQLNDEWYRLMDQREGKSIFDKTNETELYDIEQEFARREVNRLRLENAKVSA